ncbi:MAG: ABC-F family ATP-binding cassette domain-containing protein [Phototrophicaceae bacterium]
MKVRPNMTQSLEILRLSNITKYYGPKLILSDLDLSLNRGERIALVGENGVGKTTLSRLITGEETIDSGNITLAPQAEIGYLPQEVAGDDSQTVQDYIESSMGVLNNLRERLQQLEQQMGNPPEDADFDAILEEYGSVQAQFEARGGYEIEFKIEQIFTGLNIHYIETDRLINSLSGGERTRVALTGLLLRAPELLILDEPTNHLDFAGIEWLETYLADYPHALLLITHDRTFINRVANVISELNATTKQLHTYHGNYDDYLQQRNRKYEQKVESYNQQNNDRKALQKFITSQSHNTPGRMSASDEPDKFIRFFKNSQSDKTKRRKITDASGRLKDLEANRMDNPRHEWHVEFRFEPKPLNSAEPLRFDNISKSFDEVSLFENLNMIVPNGERIVLVAPNGTGKSTLLRLIMGLQETDTGSIKVSPSAIIGYLDQDGETLGLNQTVLSSFREVIQGTDSELLAELHRSGLFSDASLPKKLVSELSVGQRRKLGLARIIASQANLLLLDEPTNHLDPLSLEALEDALIKFDGTILAVSHDRRFVEKVATRIWRIENQTFIEEVVT